MWDRLQEQAFVAGTLGTIGGAGLLLVGSLVLWLALRRVSRLAEAAHLLAAGPEAAIPYGSRRDDVGAVARALMSWRQAEASGRALWRHVPVGMLTYSLRMEIRASNPAIASMFGYGYEDWIRSDPDELRNRFARLYVPRNDGRRLRLNALVAAGNVGGDGERDAVTAYLDDPDEATREIAAWALERLEERGA